ncbi:YopX family protein [Lactiplantibacillus pentosus]|uniref:YopX family protein n=1 Tax=Lactiplantibacillus pentosus TaxID=1589 RepID=UPI003D2F49CF
MIKFRAWNKVDKLMTVPLDIQLGSDGYIYWIEAMGLNGEHDEGDLDVFKLEQFTGLKDVNGRDIYEGDIVRYTNWTDHVGIVKYFKPEFGLQNIGVNVDIAPVLNMRHEMRIIGNIHENPELLEAEKAFLKKHSN